MKLELYLISAFEEYDKKHACRKHWNYQWRGRRGWDIRKDASIKLRKESFGGLLQNYDGKLYKVDESGYDAIRLFMSGKTPYQIVQALKVDLAEAETFFKNLQRIGISAG